MMRSFLSGLHFESLIWSFLLHCTDFWKRNVLKEEPQKICTTPLVLCAGWFGEQPCFQSKNVPKTHRSLQQWTIASQLNDSVLWCSDIQFHQAISTERCARYPGRFTVGTNLICLIVSVGVSLQFLASNLGWRFKFCPCNLVTTKFLIPVFQSTHLLHAHARSRVA